MQIPVVDIFAGPGGLGEGFSSFGARGGAHGPFKIHVSAEMEPNAVRTLRLRAFFRQFPPGQAPRSYYDYVEGRPGVNAPWTDATRRQWDAACQEACQLTLGQPADDEALYGHIRQVASQDRPWVLIGGPPCQAYSLVGRSRNSGKMNYRPEEDERHFLYRHYLHIVGRYRPAAFIMENVKGILTSRVGGSYIFPRILEDLCRPGCDTGPTYRVVPLVISTTDMNGQYPKDAFVIRGEDFGIPQARHRVILLGVHEDFPIPARLTPRALGVRTCVADAIAGLPRVRSVPTDVTPRSWSRFAATVLQRASRAARAEHRAVAGRLLDFATSYPAVDFGRGGLRVPRTDEESMPDELRAWLLDDRLSVHLNHEARSHMEADLLRYAYYSAFAAEHGRSPRGHIEVPEALAPEHENWTSGKFLDRFKVQLWNEPSSTVTSHLSKDGHYFIHPDPLQLRSLTVREAARLQTFPDNYFFEGSRGAQFRQVGNAVPPMLAHQVASAVYEAVSGSRGEVTSR